MSHTARQPAAASNRGVTELDGAAKPLLSRRGFVARLILRELMLLDVGDRIPGVDSLARQHGVGFGTVQQAIELIEEAGAASFTRRGAQGTFLDQLDWKTAWAVAGLPNIMGSLPLPYTKRYEGLATALFELLARHDTPSMLSYMRGAARRLEAVVDGHADFAVTSVFAAEHFRRSTSDAVSIVVSLPVRTFVSEHSLIFAEPRRKALRAGDRVGVDQDSLDQMLITEMEIAQVAGEVTMVNMPYGHILDALQQHEIDVAVWNSEEVGALQFAIQPLRSRAARQLQGAHTRAAIVARTDDLLTCRALTRSLAVSEIVSIQGEVLAGQRQARY